MKQSKIALLTLSAIALVIATPAAAQFGKLGGALGSALGGGSDAATSPDQAKKELGALGVEFAAAFGAMLQAESFTAKALGLKEEADKLDATAAYYSKGNVDDYGQLSRDIDVSEDARAKIDEKMRDAREVDAQAKEHLTAAVPHYASGMLHSAALPGKYTEWVNRAQATVNGASRNPLAAVSMVGLVQQVPQVLTVSTKLPTLIQKWGMLTKTFVTFSEKQKVNTGDLSAKIGTL